MFHTGSLAEYHEYSLRVLLSKYTAKLTSLPPDYSDMILVDDATFNDAVQKYKHVVTHYLAAKMEIWMALFMKPVYNVDGGLLTFEFAKTRGAIHFHSLLTQSKNTPLLKKMPPVLKELASEINDGMQEMNDWIKDNFCELKHSEKFKERPDTVFTSKEGESVREQFCKLSDDGKKIWSEYTQKKSNAVNKASKLIGEMFEHEYGFNALHIGNFPNDWVKPGGLPDDNYRQTCDGMKSSKDVVKKKKS